jgi:arylsulfatase
MWAQVSMTPFSQYKAWVAEGGIRNALIVSGPLVQRPKGSIHHQAVMHVADIMPTLLEVAGTSYPKTYKGKDVPPALGKSWVPLLEGRAESPRTDQDVLAWELFGNRAVRQGNWKLRWQIKPFGTEEWELFDLATDPGELKDLAAEHPDKLKEMVALWDDYARRNNVVLPNRSPNEALEKALPKRVPVQAGYPPVNLKQQFVPPKDMLAEPKQ